MITMAQRIEELRTERGLSRGELSAALGLPKNAAEKFETGRQTPTQDQQTKLAAFFDVSVFYLRGESNDRTRQETWMDAAWDQDEPARPAPAPRPAPPQAQPSQPGGGMLDALLASKQTQQLLRSIVLDTLRSPEGQALLANLIRKELAGGR